MNNFTIAHCPTCDMPTSECESGGICTICDTNLAAARTDPTLQLRAGIDSSLLRIIRDCQQWGAENGYPHPRDYPGYKALRHLGFLYLESGQLEMNRALVRLRSQLRDEPDTHGADWPGFVGHAWRNIGGWMP